MTDTPTGSALPAWVDTHCHLDFPILHDRLDEVIRRAHEANVRNFIVPGTQGSVSLEGFPREARAAWGIHPLFAHHAEMREPRGIAERLREDFARCPYAPIAVGECGFDREVSASFEVQREVFAVHLEIAAEARLPVLLHLRGGWEEALNLLRRLASQVPWVLHSFSGSPETAQRFWHFDNSYFSFSGSLCYPTARKTPEVARRVPLERVLFETDSPDILPPQWPHRHNEPAALPLIAGRFAELRQQLLADTQTQVFRNTCTVFPFLTP